MSGKQTSILNFVNEPDTKLYNSLSQEQQEIFDEYRKGHNIFITGPGGCGKSYLIKAIVKDAEEKLKKKVHVTALTGCAAVLLGSGATTLHSWAGIGLGKGDEYTLIERIERNQKKRNKWKTTELLIIDEVSMMSKQLFELLDMIGKHVRKGGSRGKYIPSTLPFGGIQVIMCGDFYQLPPVGNYKEPDTNKFCFESRLWDDTFDVQMILDKSFRQKDDKFLEILTQIRDGTIDEDTIKTLKSLVKKDWKDGSVPDGIKPVHIMPTRNQVKQKNNIEMIELGDVEEHKYTYNKAFDELYVRKLLNPNEVDILEDQIRIMRINENIKSGVKTSTKEPQSKEYEQLLSNSLYEETLTLKKGSQVMCITNLDMDEGICNGSTGYIYDFTLKIPETFKGLKDKELSNMKVFCPVVKFSNGIVKTIEPYPIISEQNIGVIVFQLPIILAWAITIHKSQGATLDYAVINIGNRIFAPGQAYVALSRVRSLDGLYLTGFKPNSIITNKKVIEFYKRFYDYETDEEEIDEEVEHEDNIGSGGETDM